MGLDIPFREPPFAPRDHPSEENRSNKDLPLHNRVSEGPFGLLRSGGVVLSSFGSLLSVDFGDRV